LRELIFVAAKLRQDSRGLFWNVVRRCHEHRADPTEGDSGEEIQQVHVEHPLTPNVVHRVRTDASITNETMG